MPGNQETKLHALKNNLHDALCTQRARWVYVVTGMVWYVGILSAVAAARGILGTPDGIGMIVFLALSFSAALVRNLFDFFHSGRKKKLWRYIGKDWFRYTLLLFAAAASYYIYMHTLSGM